MADEYGTPTAVQGYIERRPADRVGGRNFTLYAVLSAQVILSIVVFCLTVGLVATQPLGTSSPSQINFVVFVVIFSLLSWFFIFILAPRYDHLFPTRETSLIVGGIAIIFYLSAALALTVAISPAGSCTDEAYLGNNKIVAGRTSRCRLVDADIVLLWLGMSRISLI
jgi:hypothetical protein